MLMNDWLCIYANLDACIEFITQYKDILFKYVSVYFYKSAKSRGVIKVESE